jgi:hypothetical protein
MDQPIGHAAFACAAAGRSCSAAAIPLLYEEAFGALGADGGSGLSLSSLAPAMNGTHVGTLEAAGPRTGMSLARGPRPDAAGADTQIGLLDPSAGNSESDALVASYPTC